MRAQLHTPLTHGASVVADEPAPGRRVVAAVVVRVLLQPRVRERLESAQLTHREHGLCGGALETPAPVQRQLQVRHLLRHVAGEQVHREHPLQVGRRELHEALQVLPFARPAAAPLLVRCVLDECRQERVLQQHLSRHLVFVRHPPPRETRLAHQQPHLPRPPCPPTTRGRSHVERVSVCGHTLPPQRGQRSDERLHRQPREPAPRVLPLGE
mmetsp:Transcript_468/g.1319  ORF Transcript_468/g.1319 Transcript_468/m.1319 type:complete len:212 (+) Transcript_468:571-1206(+)